MKTKNAEKIIDGVKLSINLGAAPTPAHLATIILHNNGYLFGGAPKEQINNTNFCDVYNGDRHVGRITYMQQNRIGKGMPVVIVAFTTMTEGGPINTLVSLARKLR